MSEDMTAMSHEADGGQCWCGPKCEPITWVPISPGFDSTTEAYRWLSAHSNKREP